MIKDNKWVKKTYWALIIAFTILYLLIASVSTLHAISFFGIGNNKILSILLGIGYELGQAAVLFALLMTHHKNRILAWAMMILLTAVQISANVYATFKYMDGAGNNDWAYWQRSILFWFQADGSEMYKITIAWIQGALLPVVALGLTALVVDNIKLMRGDVDLEYYQEEEEYYEEEEIGEANTGNGIQDDDQPIQLGGELSDNSINFSDSNELLDRVNEVINDEPEKKKDAISIEEADNSTNESDEIKIEPVNKPRGWHLKKEFIDDDGKVFNKGKFIGTREKPTASKKA